MKSLNTTDGKNRFRFAKKSERIQKLDIDIIHRVRAKRTLDVTSLNAPTSGEKGCYLQDELERCKEHDSTSTFRR